MTFISIAGFLVAATLIQVPPGGSLSAALEETASARAKDIAADIEIVVGVKGRALSQPIVIDSALQPKGAGKLTIRGEGGVRPRISGSSPVKGWKRLGKKMNGCGTLRLGVPQDNREGVGRLREPS